MFGTACYRQQTRSAPTLKPLKSGFARCSPWLQPPGYRGFIAHSLKRYWHWWELAFSVAG